MRQPCNASFVVTLPRPERLPMQNRAWVHREIAAVSRVRMVRTACGSQQIVVQAAAM